MRTLKGLIIFVVFFFFAHQLSAQNYNSAIGLRLGYPLSFSYKTFLNPTGAVEVFGGLRGYSTYRWVNIGAAYQHHMDLSGVDGLQWYAGGGASLFFWTYKNTFFGDDRPGSTIGLLGNIGLDYKFDDAPVNLSVDWMPIFFLSGFDSGFGGAYGAIAVRYTLN